MLFQVLWKKQPLWQLLGASAGTFLGITLLLLVWQSHQAFQEYLQKEDQIFPSRYLTLAKKVSILSNIPGLKPHFSEQEIQKLKSTEGVEDLTPYTAANFNAEAILQFGESQAYRTELFLESIPARFMEAPPKEWDWTPDSDYLPVLLPNSFLQLYNFGFAPANGYPQVSKKMIGKVPITLLLPRPKRLPKSIPARIVAFSDRITSILVPESFMQWANAQQGATSAKPIHRLLLKTKTPLSPELTKQIQPYETNQEMLKEGKADRLFKLALNTTGGFGFALLLIAVLAYWLSFQMILHRSANNLRILLHIGYPPRMLWLHYFKVQLIIGTILLVLATLTITQFQQYAQNFTSKLGLELTMQPGFSTFLQALLPIAVIILLQTLSIRAHLHKLASS